MKLFLKVMNILNLERQRQLETSVSVGSSDRLAFGSLAPLLTVGR